MILDVKDLSLAYVDNTAKVYRGNELQTATNAKVTKVFTNLNFTLDRGQQVALVGRSGNGKSSLLYLLAGFEKVQAGTIFWEGQDLALMTERDLAHLRNKKLSFIFQFHNLVDDFNALENVMLPALIGNTPVAQAQVKALELLDYMGLSDRAMNYPQQLSGGERQRVAIARAIINNPEIILADEPTGNLDTTTSNEVMELINRINRDFKTTMLLVTHDTDIAASLPECWRLENGGLIIR